MNALATAKYAKFNDADRPAEIKRVVTITDELYAALFADTEPNGPLAERIP